MSGLSAIDICKIVRECKRQGVENIDIGEVSISFNKEELKPEGTAKETKEEEPVTYQVPVSTLAENPPAKTNEQPQGIRPEEYASHVFEERKFDLAVLDPSAWEEEMLSEGQNAEENDRRSK